MVMIEFDERLHRQNLIKYIQEQCVEIPVTSKVDLSGIKQWCNDHIGPQRAYHPIYEAERGFIDYFEGEWAWVMYPQHAVYLIWISSTEKRIQFALRWL